jgi:ABC-type glycerol-3-phosphate transport system permease component
MIWVAYSSLKPESAIFRDPFGLPSPGNLQWSHYARAWKEARFSEYFLNSLVVTSVSVFLILWLGSMVSYGLARFKHPAVPWIRGLFLAGLMLPVQLTIIPLFFELRMLGLLNTEAGLILVYTAGGLPFAVLVLTSFFRSVPSTLHEAAIMDGCSEWQAFQKVMLPLARPGLLTVAIFQFIGIWKEYFFAFMFASGTGATDFKTLPVGLANLAMSAQYQGENGPLFAGVVLSTLPILVIYLFLQRYIVSGIASGALKG